MTLQIVNIYIREWRWLIIGGFVFVMVVAEGLLLYGAYRHALAPGGGSELSNGGRRVLEVVWASVPAILLCVLLIASVLTLR